MKINSMLLSNAVSLCVYVSLPETVKAQTTSFTVNNNTSSEFFISIFVTDGSIPCQSSYVFECIPAGIGSFTFGPYFGGTYVYDHVILFNADACPNTKCVPTSKVEVGAATSCVFGIPSTGMINECGSSMFVPVVWNTGTNTDMSIN